MTAEEYLRNTPILKWLKEKEGRDLSFNGVAKLAQEKGLKLEKSLAINRPTFYLSLNGKPVKEGQLSTLVWFINGYAPINGQRAGGNM